MARIQSSEVTTFPIVFEDDQLLAINKPAGVVVNYSHTVKDQTIQQWMLARLGGEQGVKKILNQNSSWQQFIPTDFTDKFGTPEEIFLQRQGIVHRLDKDTSGVLLLAKDPGTMVNLLAQFKKRETRKKYLCLVHGKMRVDSSSIDAPIARSNIERFKFRVEIDGRPAVTHYRVKQFFSGLALEELSRRQPDLKNHLIKELKAYQQGFSLLECLPETGRTHQIRVHLAHIHHPLVSDAVYAGERRARLDRVWCPRQFLHAWQLQFMHPAHQEEGKKMTLKAELAEDLREVEKLLRE